MGDLLENPPVAFPFYLFFAPRDKHIACARYILTPLYYFRHLRYVLGRCSLVTRLEAALWREQRVLKGVEKTRVAAVWREGWKPWKTRLRD